MAGTKGGKGGPKRQAKGGAEAAHSSSSRGSATQQRPAQGEEAQQQREELIRRYLLHRVQAAEAAAANHSAGGDAGSSGEEGGSAAGGASAAAFLQLLAEASVRQSEVRLAIRRAGRELGLPPKKAKFLESVESRLAKHGPLLYQNASIAAGTSEWQQRRVSSKERFTEDPVRFELQLDHFELNPEATMQKILEKGRQPADASPLAAAAAALAAAQVDVKRVKIQPLRAHSCLFVDRLPTPAELAAPPPDEAAASRTENRLQLMAGQLFEELATLQHATRLAQAGFPSDHVSRMGGLASRCEYLDGRIQLAMIGTRLADDVLEALEPGMWTQRIAALVSNQHRTLHILHDAVHDSDVEVVLPSAVRGHLLMQLQAKAAALGWSGVPPELQRALRPLALIAEQLDAGERDVLLELVAVACSEAGMDAEMCGKLLPNMRSPQAPMRGTVWRAALLLLPMLATAPALPLPASWGGAPEAAPGAAGEAAGGSGATQQQGGGQSSLAARPPPSGSTEEEASTIKYVRVAASQLASDERRRGMAAAIVLALARMQLRRRLYDEAVLGLMRFVEEELSIDMASPFDTLRQLGALPPDSLLLAYSYVAVMFGLSFPSPDELGSSAAAASRVPHLAALGGADLALASLLCREGALEWEPQAAGSGGGAAADAKLRLGPEGVDGLLHWQAAAKEQQQEQQQGEGQLDSEATLPAVPRFPGTHCSVGWCPECRGVLPPDASTEDKVAALAALACGSAGSTALVQGAPGSQAPPAVQDAQEPVERLFNDEPLLAGTEIEAVPELLVEQIHTLHILGATCYVLHTRVRDVVHQARETLQFMEILASSLCGPGEHRPLPFRAEMLKQHAEAANSLAEIDTRVRMAHLMTERLRLLANHHRLQQAQELAHSVLSADGKEARILLLIVDALQEIVRDSRESVNQLQHQLDNPREAAQWAVQLRVTLNVLHAGAAAHEAQIAQGAISNTKQPYSPPISLAKKLDGPLEEMRDLSRNAHNQTKLLEAASTMLHLRAQTLVGQLRRLCHVNLLLPLESFVLQHMLAPRWEKEAAARLGQGSAAGPRSAAAEQAAAEEAARRLLEEESAKEEAEQRRRRQKEERQRAAEQKRLADIEAKRKVEQEEQRKAAAERRRQEEEAAARQRAAEQAAAEEAARRQRAAAHAAAVAAGIAQEEEEEEESDGEEEGGAAAPGEQQRKRHVRGGVKRREKREARLAREAAAAAAIPGFTPLPPAASPSKKAAAPAAAPAAAAAPVTLPATQQAAAAATPAAVAAAADRPMGAERRQQQAVQQQAVQQPAQQQAVQQPAQQRPASPQGLPLARAGSSGSVGSTGGARSGAAGGSKQTSPAVDAKVRILTVVRPKARQSAELQAASAAGTPAAGTSAPAAAAEAAPAAAPAPDTQAAAEAPATAQPDVQAVAAPPAGTGAVVHAAAAAPAKQQAAAEAPAAAAAAPAAGAAAPLPVAPAAAAAPPTAAAQAAAERRPAGPTLGTWAALAAKKPEQPAAAPAREQAAPAGERPSQQAQQAAVLAAEPAAEWPQPGREAGATSGAAGAPAPPAAPAAAAEAEAQVAAEGPRAPSPALAAAAAPAAPAPSWGKPGLNFLAALAPEQAEVAVLALPGLRNESGEFNCFLNVVLQCLWRCADFRAEVLGWVPGVYRGDAVLKALHGLFCELTALDMQSKEAAAAAASGGSPPRRQRPVIDPTPLREALNALPSQEFKMGEMSDAGELLLVLYEHIQAAAPAEAAAAAVDRAFGLHIAEAVRCQQCGRVTQEGRYTQYFHNVPAVALRGSLRSGADPGFGARLRSLEDTHQKTCDTDVGGCGAPWPVSQQLQDGAPPRIFTLQLVWESHNQEPSAIGATLRAVGETVDLSQLYSNVPGGARYRLRSLACYYGRHYSAFVRLPELHDRWVMFDDASASAIGSWADVRRRCEGGRIQPSVLFYEAEFEQ